MEHSETKPVTGEYSRFFCTYMSTAPTQETPPENQEKIRDEEGRFIPGVSGNPAGRPKGKTFSGYLRELLEEIDPETKKENFRILSEVLFKVAKRGDVQAIREFADRLDGRPKQAIEHSGEIKGNTIVFTDFSNDTENK